MRLKQWDEMTDEDKLDRSIEQTMINKELQKWQDQEKLNVSIMYTVKCHLETSSYQAVSGKEFCNNDVSE